jgi:hypothetical protein
MKMGLSSVSNKKFKSFASELAPDIKRPRVNSDPPQEIRKINISRNEESKSEGEKYLETSSSEEIKEASEDSSTESDDELCIPRLRAHQTCEKHGQLVHSFNKLTRQLLCTQCVQETGFVNTEIQCFPTALQEIKNKVVVTKDLNKQRKMELASVMTYLLDNQTKNRKVIENKLSSHIEKVRGLFTAYEKATRA